MTQEMRGDGTSRIYSVLVLGVVLTVECCKTVSVGDTTCTGTWSNCCCCCCWIGYGETTVMKEDCCCWTGKTETMGVSVVGVGGYGPGEDTKSTVAGDGDDCFDGGLLKNDIVGWCCCWCGGVCI